MTSIAVVDRLFEAHLVVADLDASIAFYRDRLGLDLAHMVPARRAAFFWVGAHSNSMLGLWQAGAGPQKTTTHIAFATTADDVIAAPQRLRSAGIVALDFNGQPTDEPVVLAWMPALAVYFLDPDGHLLEYIAMLEDEPRPDDGVMGWRAWTSLGRARKYGGARNRQGSAMGYTDTVRVLAISGSLRMTSSNSALVAAAARVAPVGVEVSVYGELADVPSFNPDVDTDTVSIGVVRFRAALEACDAIMICSPEYAHGVSGVLKNALDWIVSSGELTDKPIALLNVSARATLAYASLRETLTTMSGRVIEDASVTIPLEGSRSDAASIVQDAYLSGLVKASLAALAQVARVGAAR